MPALKANALYEGRYPLVSALSRPVIAQHLVAAAARHGADAVAHGCTGKGNDQVRFEVSTRALNPDLEVLAPVRVWGMTREDSIHYAYDHGIPITATKEKVYSIDDNLWGRAIECGEMEDPWNRPPVGRVVAHEADGDRRRATSRSPSTPGVPVAVDDEPMDLVPLIEHVRRGRRLLRLGPPRHGREPPGRHQEPGDLRVPVGSRPHRRPTRTSSRSATSATWPGRSSAWRSATPSSCTTGLWFSPLRQALDAFIDETQRFVTGEVRLHLEPGSLQLTGRRAPRSLYDYSLATYDAADNFRHEDSAGFVRLWGLSTERWSAVQGPGEHMTTLWHGRFEGGPSPELLAFSESLSFDRRLAADDVDGLAGPRPRARARRASSPPTRAPSCSPRSTVSASSSPRAPSPSCASDEDVHTAIERRVTELAGQPGAKLHTGRSRNDQVATALRLFCKRELAAVAGKILALQGVLLARADEAGGAYLPGYTHLQRAQPVLLAHHLLAHGWALARDVDRLLATRRRLDVSPLGAGALAGSSLPLDPAATAVDLGFNGAFENSLDAVGDRDFVAESLFDLALLAVHLSRIGEEVCLWSTDEFGFLRLDDAWSTGSSMLPQKKNPDIAELVRGKAGRVIGDLTGFLATLKGLPLAYNRDLQEDKEPLFDALDQLRPRPRRPDRPPGDGDVHVRPDAGGGRLAAVGRDRPRRVARGAGDAVPRRPRHRRRPGA